MANLRNKRLIFCFDGTWNSLAVDCPTNVVMLAQMVKPVARDGTPQLVYYDEGIGNSKFLAKRLYDGAVGGGMIKIMREAYRFLIFNYESGDQIFAFGFSRGAYTARSFIGFIRHAGILDIGSASKINKAIEIYQNAPAGEMGLESGLGLRFRAAHCKGVCVSEIDIEFRARIDNSFDPKTAKILDIQYVGVWDTVRALGVPDIIPGAARFNRKYGFHDAVLTSKIKAARHAIAIDELRPAFRATLFGREKVAELNRSAEERTGRKLAAWEQPYMERWFPGIHGAVGGGGSRRGLSDATLAWVLRGAVKEGLELRNDDDAQTYKLRPDCFDHLENEATRSIWQRGPIGWLRHQTGSPREGPAEIAEVALPALRRWFGPAAQIKGGGPYRPGALAAIAKEIDDWPPAAMPEFKSGHVVVRGDTLGRLAARYCGNAERWNEIYEANLDRLDDPDDLPIGFTLRIPCVDDADTADVGF